MLKSDAEAAVEVENTPAALETPKKARGRPRGTTKTGGRVKGTPDKDRSATIARIQKEADPLGFLASVVRGGRFSAGSEPNAKEKTWIWPSLDQRITAAATLARKVMPDQKAVEQRQLGEPITVRINI